MYTNKKLLKEVSRYKLKDPLHHRDHERHETKKQEQKEHKFWRR